MANKQDIIKAVQTIISQTGEVMSLRQIFYRLVATEQLDNTKPKYKWLSKILVEARKSGQVKYKDIEDRSRTVFAGDNDTWSVASYFNVRARQFKDVADDWGRQYVERWYGQDNYVEVWMEKQALQGVFERVCKQEKVRLCVVKGYSSLTYLYDGIKRYKAKRSEGKHLVCLYFGDFDASGEDISRYIDDTFAEYGLDVEFHKIALTPEQIEEYGLPPAMAKSSDSRSASFTAEHGDMAVELDALEPEILRGLVSEAVSRYFDDDIYNTVRRDHINKHKPDFERLMREWVKEMAEEMGILDGSDDDDPEPSECYGCGETIGDDDDARVCSGCGEKFCSDCGSWSCEHPDCADDYYCRDCLADYNDGGHLYCPDHAPEDDDTEED